MTKNTSVVHMGSCSALFISASAKMEDKENVKTWFLSWLCGDAFTLKEENLQIFKWHGLQ